MLFCDGVLSQKADQQLHCCLGRFGALGLKNHFVIYRETSLQGKKAFQNFFSVDAELVFNPLLSGKGSEKFAIYEIFWDLLLDIHQAPHTEGVAVTPS